MKSPPFSIDMFFDTFARIGKGIDTVVKELVNYNNLQNLINLPPLRMSISRGVQQRSGVLFFFLTLVRSQVESLSVPPHLQLIVSVEAREARRLCPRALEPALAPQRAFCRFSNCLAFVLFSVCVFRFWHLLSIVESNRHLCIDNIIQGIII